MGLATSYSIVNRHDGSIDVESEPGRGSTFHILLPATLGANPAESAGLSRAHRGSGTVMVMDDQAVVRNAVSTMLKSFGYSAICTETGAETIERLRAELRAGRKLAAVILDITIPGGPGGREVVGEVRKLDPHVPVFAASGYADDPIMANPRALGFSGSIGKPFTVTELGNLLNAHFAQDRMATHG